MYWNRSAAEITAAWQAEIESKLETGSTALLLAGNPDDLIVSIATLLGQENSTIQRNDVATPYLVAGGNSALWLGLLLSPLPAGNQLSAPPPNVVFGGADDATYLANVNLTTALATQATTAANKSSIPSGMSDQFAPHLQPGAATPWEMLPFVEVGEEPAPALVAASVAPDPTVDWIAWGIMLLTLCLVLSALLI